MRKITKFQNPAGALPAINGGIINPATVYATGNKLIAPTTTATTLNQAQLIPQMNPFSGPTAKQKGALALGKVKSFFIGSGGNAGGSSFSLGGLQTGLNAATDLASSFIKPDEDSTYNAEQGLGNALIQSGNPYAAAAGAVVKLNSMLNQTMGTNINTMNKKQYTRAGLNGFGNAANTALGFLSNIAMPGLGALAGKTEDLSISTDAKNLRGAFAGSLNDMETDESMSGKRYWLGGKQINSNIQDSKYKNDILTALNINTNNVISSVPYAKEQLLRQNLRKMYDINSNTPVGKEGMKLLTKDELAEIYSKRTVNKFQEGGSIMIPDGALHAHKHHMEDVNPELAEDLTKKGIPVVTEGEGGELNQVAEVEREEAILSKPLTEQIEALWKDGSEEAMIEAGKLIVCALFTDAVDNTGLIKKIE